MAKLDLRKIDLKVTMLLVGIIVAIPLIFPLAPPIGISPQVRDAYNIISSLPDGSLVWWAEGWRGGGDQRDEFIALYRHFMQKHFRVIFWYNREEEPPLTEEIWLKLFGTSPDKWEGYGKELVNLGLITAPGHMYAMADDLTAIVKTDYYGNSLKDYNKLPMLKGVKGLKDCVLRTSAGMSEAAAWREIAPGQYQIPWSATGHWFSTIEPLYRAKIVDGALHGLRGAAEYEILMGAPAGGCKLIMGAFALGAFVFVMLIIGAVYHVTQRVSVK